MTTPPRLVREILEYEDGTRKIVNFNPLPMSDDEQKVEESAPEAEVSAEAEAPVESPAEEVAPVEEASADSESA